MIDLAVMPLDRFQAKAAEAARLLRALSNERRLMILCQLGGGERAVGKLAPLVGLSQSALSQHLAVLREDGLVATRREGVSIRYRLADPNVARIIAVLAEIYCPPDAEESRP
ncbi:MAG: ArsR/SmtB family transcription factor [Brevundimonas sp.]|jgi:DNA-binding transcriptional ArsR family regulator|uniref:ArsR/SmtB family transcription factor n=1 Tax=Brevundimonas sp. TaxID=1871086 RepID=UPI0022C91E37|nr:metalloregulator ArsR/SmtB family transcription factor [Brevundimonas sp.]MCZ8086197.1 metalloregulator ArsR/SmtB family transcription factor [Brevundimonas sp.]MCZ8194926.1 metalloregulator ArsR/SmtB family transcription factor [Brevundimonas sp.]